MDNGEWFWFTTSSYIINEKHTFYTVQHEESNASHREESKNTSYWMSSIMSKWVHNIRIVWCHQEIVWTLAMFFDILMRHFIPCHVSSEYNRSLVNKLHNQCQNHWNSCRSILTVMLISIFSKKMCSCGPAFIVSSL